jgi:hypothetical protein
MHKDAVSILDAIFFAVKIFFQVLFNSQSVIETDDLSIPFSFM